MTEQFPFTFYLQVSRISTKITIFCERISLKKFRKWNYSNKWWSFIASFFLLLTLFLQITLIAMVRNFISIPYGSFCKLITKNICDLFLFMSLYHVMYNKVFWWKILQNINFGFFIYIPDFISRIVFNSISPAKGIFCIMVFISNKMREEQLVCWIIEKCLNYLLERFLLN